VIAALVASVGVLLLPRWRRRRGDAGLRSRRRERPRRAGARPRHRRAYRRASGRSDRVVGRRQRGVPGVARHDGGPRRGPARVLDARRVRGRGGRPASTRSRRDAHRGVRASSVRRRGRDGRTREQRAIAALRQIEERHGAGDSESHGDSTHPEGSRNAPLALVGVAAVAVGFVAVVNRSIAAAIDPSTVVVTLIGALAAVAGVRYANERRGRDRRAADPGEPERRAPATVPRGRPRRADRPNDRRVPRRVRLPPRAPRASPHRRGRGGRPGPELLDRGGRASRRGGDVDRRPDRGRAFLASDASYPIGVRLRAGIRGRSRYGYGLRAAIDAIGRLDDDNPAEAAR